MDDNSFNTKVPKPKSVDFSMDFNATNITYRWWSAKFLLLLLFCFAWDGSIFFLINVASKGSILTVIILPLIYVALGTGMTYYTIARLINRTFITINRHWLTITH